MVKNGDSFVQCFLSFRMLCVCQVFQYLEAQPPVSYRAHISTFGIFQTFQRGFEKVPKKSVLVKVNDLWVSDQLVQLVLLYKSKNKSQAIRRADRSDNCRLVPLARQPSFEGGNH